MGEEIGYRIVVSGWVQGVGFRFYAQRLAHHYGVAGCVRNLASGEVEIEVEGERPSVEQFIKAVKQGPDSARVSDVEIRPSSELKEYSSFEIRY